MSPPPDIHSTTSPISPMSASSSSPGISVNSDIGSQINQSPRFGLKPIHEYTVNDCCEFLQSIQLEQYIPIFIQHKVDGILMSCFIHDHIGNQILSNMGITDSTNINKLTKAIKNSFDKNSKSPHF